MTRRRGRLAVVLAVAVALAALTVVLAGAWLAGRAANEPTGVVTRVDQLGDQVAIVQVDGAGASTAARSARTSTLRWTLGTLGMALVPVAALAWVLAGRLTPRRVDEEPLEVDGPPDATGEADRLREERERDRRQLQEVVHELRTPLAVAATNLDLASTTPGIDRELGEQLAAARRGVERLARTVDDLAAHGRLAVEDGTADLAHEVRALAAEHGGTGAARGIAIAVEAPERLVVPADRSAVHTATANLLANALRLAPAGSIVRLACGEHEDWAWIAVRDEGPGLSPDDHERAFHRYWRGRYDLDRETGEGEARGLGLTICRQMTEAQGGHVTVRSAVGVGSTFVVWLPKTTEARSERVVADDGVHHLVDPLPDVVVGAGAATGS